MTLSIVIGLVCISIALIFFALSLNKEEEVDHPSGWVCQCEAGECCVDCCECECNDCCSNECCADDSPFCECQDEECCIDCCGCECDDCCNDDCCVFMDDDDYDDLLIIPESQDIFSPSPQNTPVTVRLRAPKEGQKFYEVTRTHRLKHKVLPCRKKKIGDYWTDEGGCSCPICDHYVNVWKQSEEALYKEDKIDLQTEARFLKPIERYYYNVLINEEPKVLSVGKSLHSKIVNSIVGKDGVEPLGDVTHPENGRDLNILCNIRGEFGVSFPDYRDSFFTGVRSLTNNEMRQPHFEISGIQKEMSKEALGKELQSYMES